MGSLVLSIQPFASRFSWRVVAGPCSQEDARSARTLLSQGRVAPTRPDKEQRSMRRCLCRSDGLTALPREANEKFVDLVPVLARDLVSIECEPRVRDYDEDRSQRILRGARIRSVGATKRAQTTDINEVRGTVNGGHMPPDSASGRRTLWFALVLKDPAYRDRYHVTCSAVGNTQQADRRLRRPTRAPVPRQRQDPGACGQSRAICRVPSEALCTDGNPGRPDGRYRR